RPLVIIAGIVVFVLLNRSGVHAEVFQFKPEYDNSTNSFAHNAYIHLGNKYWQDWLNKSDEDWAITPVAIGKEEVPDFLNNHPGPNKNFPVPAASTWLQNKGYRTYFMGGGGKAVWQGYKNLGEAFLPYGFDIAKDGFKHWGKEKPDWGFKEDDHDDASLFGDA